MSAGHYDLTVEQGATFSKTFTLKQGITKDDPNPTPCDFTGYTGVAEIREDYARDFPLVAFTVTFPPSGSVTGSIAASGSINISLTSEQTLVLPAGITGVWDLLLYQGDTVTRLLEGQAFIYPVATR